MPKGSSTQSVYSTYITVADTVKSALTVDLELDDVNIHVEDNDVYYGDGTNMTAVAIADSVITFRHINLRHIYFKNKTGGSTAHLSIVGTITGEIPSPGV